jgi:lipoate-protein ligase B
MCGGDLKKLFRIDLGLTDYADCRLLQKDLVVLRARNQLPDCLLFTEHKPAITMGRGTSRENLLASPETLKNLEIALYETERGGDITYHGPGQTAVYPIVDLNGRGRDTHQYLRDLERVVISTLRDFGIKGGTKPGLTGVWVGDDKLAAVGVAVSKWVAYHGFALNVTPNLEHFKLINPCGIREFGIGSMESVSGKKFAIEEVDNIIAEKFSLFFGYDMVKVDNIESIRLKLSNKI